MRAKQCSETSEQEIAASPKRKGGFFTIDRRTWRKVCDVGINEAIAYIVMAQGTTGNNRSTSWSANSLHTYAGVTWDRGKAAIARLVQTGLIEYADGHTKNKPRYELRPWAELAERDYEARLASLSESQRQLLKGISTGTVPRSSRSQRNDIERLIRLSLVRQQTQGCYEIVDRGAVEAEPDRIWLPNTLVTGTERGEESPMKRLRRSGDIWALRLLIDLYHTQNLRSDGGISPWVIRQRYSRRQIGQRGPFIIWAFKPEAMGLWWQGPFEVHHERPKANAGADHPAWGTVRALLNQGLLTFVPHLWDNDSDDQKAVPSEIVHAYGIEGGGEPIEIEMGRAAHEAARAMALPARVEAAAREGFHLLAPVRTTVPNCCLIGVGRLRYRPHTRLTGKWFAELQTSGRQFVLEYEKLAMNDGDIKGSQGSSRFFNDLQSA